MSRHANLGAGLLGVSLASPGLIDHEQVKAAAGIIVLGAAAVVVVRKVVRGLTKRSRKPTIIATWRFGQQACEAGAQFLQQGGPNCALNAVEEAINRIECDGSIRSYVGLGGLPNDQGEMEYDAAMMDGKTLKLGCVMSLRGVPSAIRVARALLEHPTVNALAGDGALRFAQLQGYQQEVSLPPQAQHEWQQYHSRLAKPTETLNVFAFLAGANPGDTSYERAHSHTLANSGFYNHSDGTHRMGNSHDTIGVIAMDAAGNLAVGISTSGLAFKPQGRVGDGPLVGSGFYADNRAGAATATGQGEEIMRTCLSFLVVENMRRGSDPTHACQEAIKRFGLLHPRSGPIPHVSVIAMDTYGNTGAATTISPANPITPQIDASSNSGAFQYVVFEKGQTRVCQVAAV